MKQVFSVAVKNFKTDSRFKFNYVANTFGPALMNFGLFATIFYGVFSSGAGTLSEVNGQNFIAFTIVGALASTLFNLGFASFTNRFQAEKYWETMYAMLASPLSPWAILLGTSLSDLVRFSGVVTFFLVFAYAVWPVPAAAVLESVLLLLLLYLIVAGFSLIRGVLLLVNENYDPFVQYGILATSYVSCFYFPQSFLPPVLQNFALINPIYFVVYNLRAVWLGLPVQPLFLLFSVVAGVIGPIIGTYAFRAVWRNHDISGY
jgi:ABC-type polysaccharide/polyol phosphate export permease